MFYVYLNASRGDSPHGHMQPPLLKAKRRSLPIGKVLNGVLALLNIAKILRDLINPGQ